MKLIVKKPFDWAHRGVEVKSYAKGDAIETDEQDLIKVSQDEGWAAPPRAEKTPPVVLPDPVIPPADPLTPPLVAADPANPPALPGTPTLEA